MNTFKRKKYYALLRIISEYKHPLIVGPCRLSVNIREFEQLRRLRQIKRHLKLNISAMMNIW